jgi:Cellulose binding domain
VAVTNLGDPINGWTLRWSFDAGQTVGQAWNAAVTQSSAAVTATGVSYKAAPATGVTDANSGSLPGPAPISFQVCVSVKAGRRVRRRRRPARW